MDKIKVLLVDDEPSILHSFSEFLSTEFDLGTANNAEQAISILEEAEGAFDVAVIDMVMNADEESGLKLIEQIGNMPLLERPAPVILTGHAGIGNASKCMEAGARSYVEKGRPDTLDLLEASIKRAAALPETSKVLANVIEVLVSVIEGRDLFEFRHLIRITDWSRAVLEQMDKAKPHEKLDLEITARLHNIGKSVLPAYISDKPGVRTPKERELFETHAKRGRNLLSSIDIFSQQTLDGILHHHERWDGSGYPHGLKGKDIPPSARIIAVACEYDHAFSPKSNRTLRNPQGAKEAIIRFKNEGKLDPDIVDAFIKAFMDGKITKEDTEGFADAKFTDAMRQMEYNQFDQVEKSCDEAIAAIREEDEYFRAALCVAAGDLLRNSGEDSLYNTAAKYYAQAIKLRPAYAEAYYKRGLAYQRQSMWEHADAHYAIATAIVPSYVEAHLARGEVRYSGNFLNEADKSFDLVLSLIGDIDPDNPDIVQLNSLKVQAYLGKGRIQARKGDKQQALTNYQSALEICENKEELGKFGERIENQKESL